MRQPNPLYSGMLWSQLGCVASCVQFCCTDSFHDTRIFIPLPRSKPWQQPWGYSDLHQQNLLSQIWMALSVVQTLEGNRIFRELLPPYPQPWPDPMSSLCLFYSSAPSPPHLSTWDLSSVRIMGAHLQAQEASEELCMPSHQHLILPSCCEVPYWTCITAISMAVCAASVCLLWWLGPKINQNPICF